MTAKENYREGVRHVSSGDLDAAIVAFERALSVDATFYLAHLGWSQALDRKGDVDEAILQAERAVALAPDEPLAHASLSRLYQQMGRIEDAEAALAESMRLQRA